MSIDTPAVISRNGEESFNFQDEALDIKLTDFWRWASSDLLNNAMRGVLAEFLISKALNAIGEYRLEWDAFDIETESELKIEVKSSAYLQSWKQLAYSQISFGIAPTRGWNARTNEYNPIKKRQSDIYIFCVLTEKDPQQVNLMQLAQWDFYILETSTLDEKLGEQQTMGLNTLLSLNPIKVDYLNLASEISKLEEKLLMS